MVVVFGSINLDLTARLDRLPQPGETLAGRSFSQAGGGKGANQALAARRAGAQVRLYGAVGDDAFAAPALSWLVNDGVDLSGVRRVDAPTGVALIQVDAAGENTIAVVAGANAHARADQVPELFLSASNTLLLQLETPLDEVLALAQRARRRGMRVILNAAPAHALTRDWLDAVDVLVVNESEAGILGRSLALPTDAQGFVDAVASAKGPTTVVTLGSRGALARSGEGSYVVPAHRLDPVDTVGAGDAFVGVLAAALDDGHRITRAFARASAAGALACRGAGAQAALPRDPDIGFIASRLESSIAFTPVTS